MDAAIAEHLPLCLARMRRTPWARLIGTHPHRLSAGRLPWQQHPLSPAQGLLRLVRHCGRPRPWGFQPCEPLSGRHFLFQFTARSRDSQVPQDEKNGNEKNGGFGKAFWSKCLGPPAGRQESEGQPGALSGHLSRGAPGTALWRPPPPLCSAAPSPGPACSPAHTQHHIPRFCMGQMHCTAQGPLEDIRCIPNACVCPAK